MGLRFSIIYATSSVHSCQNRLHISLAELNPGGGQVLLFWASENGRIRGFGSPAPNVSGHYQYWRRWGLADIPNLTWIWVSNNSCVSHSRRKSNRSCRPVWYSWRLRCPFKRASEKGKANIRHLYGLYWYWDPTLEDHSTLWNWTTTPSSGLSTWRMSRTSLQDGEQVCQNLTLTSWLMVNYQDAVALFHWSGTKMDSSLAHVDVPVQLIPDAR